MITWFMDAPCCCCYSKAKYDSFLKWYPLRYLTLIASSTIHTDHAKNWFQPYQLFSMTDQKYFKGPFLIRLENPIFSNNCSKMIRWPINITTLRGPQPIRHMLNSIYIHITTSSLLFEQSLPKNWSRHQLKRNIEILK